MSVYRRRFAAGLVTGVLALSIVTGLGPRAAPAAAAQRSSTTSQIKISVSELTPVDIRPKSIITVSGTLTNTTRQKLTKPAVRLQAGPALTSRSELQAADAIAPTSDAATCAFGKPLANLPPGTAISFTTRCSAKTLGLTQLGVYPLLVNVNAIQADGTHARVGQANTFLPYFPTRPRAPTQVSWFWPIVDHPHRLSSGVFHDDQLRRTLAPGGRLGQAVQDALDAPTKLALMVAIDPAVVADAAGMTDPHGYRVQHGSRSVRGKGGPVAADWLTRLRTLVHRPNVTVVSLPYADPDLVALTRAGLTAEMSTGYVQGTSILAKNLGVHDTAPIAYPPGGELDDATLYALAGLRLSAAVLSPDALPTASAADSTTPDAIAALPAQGANMLGLVTDPALSALVNRPVPKDDHRLAYQRYLAELAMITAEEPNTSRHVLIVPPRRWNPSPIAPDLLAGTTGVPWSTSASAQDLLAAPTAARRGALDYPGAAGHAELPPSLTATIAQAAKQIDGFRSTVNNRDADTLLTPYYEAVLRAGSSAWRYQPERGAAYLDDLTYSVGQLRRQVHLVVPATSTYSLASSSSPLVLTVANTLPVTVGVRVSVTARGTSGFHTDPMNVEPIPPRSRRTIKVPSHVERSGEFTVTAALTTPAGQPLGRPVELRVRSTAYGAVALGITGGALALLLLLVARRLVRRIRRPRDPNPPDPADRPMQPTAP